MRKLINRIGYFIFHTDEHFINKHIYYHEGEPNMGYVICFGWYFCGIFGYDRIAVCCDEKQVMKELEIRAIDIN